ncbi:MAG: hypothetical protein HZA14_04340 [Nitrospirae bacterium]|nr:hypothetical protein [Nitrospirota bacterium]
MVKRASVDHGIYTEEQLLEMVRRWVPPERVPRRIRIKDTSDFFRVDFDDVVVLGGVPYLVRSNERERRFGMDDEQKFWVKRAIDLITGRVKILKWTFWEKFKSRIGNLIFECVRSPRKEARILNIVRGRTDFMQGETFKDSAGNPLRVMDFIHGKTLDEIIPTLGNDHEDFFFNYYHKVLSEFIAAIEGIRFLHENGEKHGDIRRDHIIKDKDTGLYRWIDFDYNYRHRANKFSYDLFGIGNTLIFITGRGDITTHDLSLNAPDVLNRLSWEDVNIVFHNRVANLKKVFPYIPEFLNRVIMHFSAGAKVYYGNTSELLEDLRKAVKMTK